MYLYSPVPPPNQLTSILLISNALYDMANPLNLPPTLIAQIDEVAASIPIEHHEMPADSSIVSYIDSVLLHLNNWAFLNGFAYVSASGSAKERR